MAVLGANRASTGRASHGVWNRSYSRRTVEAGMVHGHYLGSSGSSVLPKSAERYMSSE